MPKLFRELIPYGSLIAYISFKPRNYKVLIYVSFEIGSCVLKPSE